MSSNLSTSSRSEATGSSSPIHPGEQRADSSTVADFMRVGARRLAERDPQLFALLERENARQADVLTMVASSSFADPAALICNAMPTMNVTAEGYPGRRFHAGCRHIDEIEQLAIDRACRVFGARYANVQPMSATVANQAVMFSLLKPGETLLGMRLDSGGHLTHGARASYSGQLFKAFGYGLDSNERIDYDSARQLALEHRPKLIICGTTAYPRQIDWARFRAIADEVGAYLLADITHIAGLVAAGLHPSPIDHAHFTTTCTHKQLYGARGGLILIGQDWQSKTPGGRRTLAQAIQKKIFPYLQGAPNQSAIAAKAYGFEYLESQDFRDVAQRVLSLARSLAASFEKRGYRVITGGTDNHIVMVDVTPRGITGVHAEKALEDCGLIVNKNIIPNDPNPPSVTSGIRLGTNGLAIRGLTAKALDETVEWIDQVLTATRGLRPDAYELDPRVAESVRRKVATLCRQFPFATFPNLGESSP